jgi:hypothetical protein
MTHSDPDKINPPEPIEQEDGSFVWPTDPDYEPEPVEQDLTPVEADDDYTGPDEGTDEDDEEVEDDG